MTTPDLQLNTLFVLNGDGCITSTREPRARPGPAFFLVRSPSSCAWAVRADVPPLVAGEVGRFAREEPPASELRDPPIHESRYVALLGGRIESGPAFAFPETVVQSPSVMLLQDPSPGNRNFPWLADEMNGVSPVLAILQDGEAVSICFCARRSNEAAEAGVETEETFRGRGFAPLVTAAWALAVRSTRRIPLFSTSWSNSASIAVARKLGLMPYASDWSLS